jgi:hypothetical protein
LPEAFFKSEGKILLNFSFKGKVEQGKSYGEAVHVPAADEPSE